jgi:hypothetical protein
VNEKKTGRKTKSGNIKDEFSMDYIKSVQGICDPYFGRRRWF